VPTVVARLPDDLRDALKAPLGPVFTDVDELLALVDGPLLTVGDVVTAHLVRAGKRPDLAVVDERTKRGPVDDETAGLVPEPDATVENPAATVTGELIEAMREGLSAGGPSTILVDGEEDLAVLPALLLAPTGASVVYGQPDEGMVLVGVYAGVRERAREWLERMATDEARLFELLDG
jgi:uncharacterized protein (UPF0218 family)